MLLGSSLTSCRSLCSSARRGGSPTPPKPTAPRSAASKRTWPPREHRCSWWRTRAAVSLGAWRRQCAQRRCRALCLARASCSHFASTRCLSLCRPGPPTSSPSRPQTKRSPGGRRQLSWQGVFTHLMRRVARRQCKRKPASLGRSRPLSGGWSMGVPALARGRLWVTMSMSARQRCIGGRMTKTACQVWMFSRPAESDQLFMYSSPECVALGGGSECALYVDKGMVQGASQPCANFKSRGLSSTPTFAIKHVECWVFDIKNEADDADHSAQAIDVAVPARGVQQSHVTETAS